MKKSIAILMLTLCLALLCACGETAEPAPETPAPDAQEAAAQTLPEIAPAEQLEESAPEKEEAAAQEEAPAQEAPAAQPEAPAQEPEEAPEEPSALETALTFVDQDAAALVQAIGEPLETQYETSCSGPGDDGVWTYDGFTVYTYRENGVETIVDAE